MPSGISKYLRLLSATVIAALGTATAVQAAPPADPVTAFVHVNVLPMDRERVLRDQTVLVEDDKIVAVGPNVAVPRNARVIDGHRTAYLSPGLADMHVHSETKNDLAVYLANGVTTVLSMGGTRASFVDNIVPRSNSGTIPGPHVYTSFLVDGSPEYNGFIVKTAEEGRAIVGLAKTNGYDFMKVYNNLSPKAFYALVDEGRRLHVPVVGHGLTQVGLEKQLAAGQVLVAHAEEFFYTYFTPPGAELTDAVPDVARIPDAIAMVKHYGGTVTADLGNYGLIAHQIGHKEVVDAILNRRETRYLSPDWRLRWRLSTYVDKTAKLLPRYEFLKTFIKAMADAGVPLVTGTDSPSVPGDLPGYSLHQDLEELEGAGLTPFQTLSAATREPGEFIARTIGGDRFGTIAVGYRADMILSEADPLSDLKTLDHPIGVMAHGRWYTKAELQRLLDEVAEQYRIAGRVPGETPAGTSGQAANSASN
jgi:hypothetical protein